MIKNYSIVLTALFLLCIGQLSFAQNDAALDIADRYLKQNAPQLRLTPADLADYTVQDNYTSAHNGVTHLYLVQKHAGTEVLNGMLNINLLPNGEVLHVGNRFITDLQSRVNTTEAQITAAEAVTTVMQTFNVQPEIPFVLTETERKNDKEILFHPDGIALEPIKAQLVYQPLADKSVRLTWMVELYERSAQNWWNARVDAVTGDVISYRNQVIKCDFGSPADVCAEAHPQHSHAHTASSAAMLDDDVNNAYNVLPLYVESPNHGTREIMVQPSDAVASPFGWHDVDGAAGEEYTITRGNNVHAYQDIFNNNSSIGDEPDGGDSLVFDFPFDPNVSQPYTQIDAAVTNLFYWNNLMHDIWYRYGFDEASGNFQVNNYGNGGIEDDEVQAECLDGSGTNNANFGTGQDGTGARMQMYFWGGGLPPTSGGPDVLIVEEPASVAGEYVMVPAAFGGQLPDTDMPLTGNIVIADDGTGTTTDACEDLVNAEDIDGNIALIDRGECEFGFKALAAENAGAIAVIICNNVTNDPFPMAGGAVGNQVTIPTVMIGLEDCNVIKTGAPDLTGAMAQTEEEIPNPGPNGVDGDFDNGIICHEYGHGISIRLTGGPGTGGCLTNNEQMGEGWSDWFGLVLTTDADNNADQGRGIGTYAIEQPTNGGGIRTHRYSRNMTVNPHTYADINSESIPHGVGSVWCAMLWDLYWNLRDEYGYDPDIYNGTGGNNIAMQLVTDGLKLQACDPDFIDGRDAILAADMANYDGANQCLIWETFARRGLGVNATGGGEEDFELPLLCSNAVGIEKTGTGGAEAGSVIDYTLSIANGIQEDLENFVITDILPPNTTYVEGSSTCGGTVSDGILTITVENLPSLVVTECSYQVTVDDGDYSQIALEDSFEDGLTAWEVQGTGAAEWVTTSNNPFEGNTAIYAENAGTESEQIFVLAENYELTGENPAFGFYHRYDTEEGWDGGVVEIQFGGFNTWFDAGQYMSGHTYDGPVEENDASAISGQEAFHGSSNGYVYTLVDLTDFAGSNVKIRFRFATDGFVDADGWYVDNVQFFSELVTIENVACITNQDGDEVCASAETTVFGTTTSTNDIDVYDSRAVLFPNPNAGKFTLQIDGVDDQNAEILIYAADGRLVQSAVFGSGETYAGDLSKYGSGVYFAEIIAGDLHTVRKVVVRF